MRDHEQMLLITNNPLAAGRFAPPLPLLFNADWGYLDVLIAARERVHLGWRLLTHPLAGSVKPFQTPYRSLLLARPDAQGKPAADDVLMIENSIAACHRQMQGKSLPCPDRATADDFAVVDVSLLTGALRSL